MSFVVKTHSNLIIIGGGIFGAAVAYYFKRDNPDKEVIVFERNELCSGNTSFAATLLTNDQVVTGIRTKIGVYEIS